VGRGVDVDVVSGWLRRHHDGMDRESEARALREVQERLNQRFPYVGIKVVEAAVRVAHLKLTGPVARLRTGSRRARGAGSVGANGGLLVARVAAWRGPRLSWGAQGSHARRDGRAPYA